MGQNNNPFNQEEQKVFDRILELNADFSKLDSWEIAEWTEAIHKLQDVIIRSAFRRQYPNYFK